MRFTKLLLISSLFLGIFTSGCDDSSSGESTTSGPITEVRTAAQLDALFEQIAELQCSSTCSADPITEAIRTTPDCKQILIFEQRDNRHEYLYGFETGSIEFNASFYQCVYEKVIAGECDNVSEMCRERGDEVLTGTLMDGEACLYNRECQGYCYLDDEEAELGCAMGVCRSDSDDVDIELISVMEGEACGDDYESNISRDCMDGFVCNEELDMPVCVRVNQVGLGEECGGEDKECSEGYCLIDRDSESFRCGELAAVGEECSRSLPCTFGAICQRSGRDMPGVCIEKVAIGGACETIQNDDYDENDCVFGAVCTEGTCQEVRFESESCDESTVCRKSECQNNVCAKVCE